MIIDLNPPEYREYTPSRNKLTYLSEYMDFMDTNECAEVDDRCVTNRLDRKTIQLADGITDIDPELIEFCRKTQNSDKVEDVVVHRNLAKQVYAVTRYDDKSSRQSNNNVVHKGDELGITLAEIRG